MAEWGIFETTIQNAEKSFFGAPLNGQVIKARMMESRKKLRRPQSSV